LGPLCPNLVQCSFDETKYFLTGGIFAIRAKDESVWYRTYEQGGKPFGKVLHDTDQGVLWNKIQVGKYFHFKKRFSIKTNHLTQLVYQAVL